MSLNARRFFLESYIFGRQVLSTEKNEKVMPSVTGQVDLHIVGRISPAKQDEKWKKNIFTTEHVKGIVDHMNDDHSNSLVHYCHLLGMSNITEKDKVLMAGIDQNGFDLKVNGENIRFELESPFKEAREVRKVLISLAKKLLI